jgi:hypothetical protein
MLAPELKAYKIAQELTMAKIHSSADPANAVSGKDTADFFQAVFDKLASLESTDIPNKEEN